MIVYATKVSVKKAIAGVLVVGAVVWGVSALVPDAAEPASAESTAAEGMDAKLKNNEQRVALLNSFGWKVEPEPRSEREVQVPKTFDETYEAYNAIQLAQGLDLTPYQGKRATLYTYELTEYPSGAEGVTANLLIRKNKLIAADISAAEADGFVHGITGMPEEKTAAPQTGQPQQDGQTTPEEGAETPSEGTAAPDATPSEDAAAPSDSAETPPADAGDTPESAPSE